MPHCLCDKNITGYVRQRGSQSVFMNVRLCSDSVMVWWQHVNGIPVLPPHPFLSLKMCVCVLWRPEVVLWMAPGPDLAPNPPLPTHLIILNQDNIRHAPHGAQVRGHVISAIIFCLEHYFPQDYPPPLHSQHFLSLQLNTSARCVPMNAFLKVYSFPLRQQVKTLCFNNSGRRRVLKNTMKHYIRQLLLYSAELK